MAWLRLGLTFWYNCREEKQIVVGLPGFEPESVRPKRTSIDQTNPQARVFFPKAIMS